MRQLIALLASVLLASAPAQDRVPQLTPDQWREDLEVLWRELPKVHANPFHHVSRDELRAAFDALEARADGAARHEMIVGIAQLVARLGPTDGHSELWIAPNNERVGFHHLPIGLYRFADGFRVQTARDDVSELLAGEVVRLGDLAVEEAFSHVATAISSDNVSQASAYATLLMVVPEVLHATGVSASPDEVPIEVRLDDGRTVEAVLPAIAPQDHLYQWRIEPRHLPPGWQGARPADGPTPFYLAEPDEPRLVDYEDETGILLLRLDVLRDGPDETLAALYERVFSLGDELDARALVIDVRQNGGGNNQLNRALIHHLIRSERFRERGRLFLVIGRHTFSAASHLSTYVESETDAILVGEPTGGSPNHFGDAATVVLPHSGLQVALSAYYWQNSLPWDRRTTTDPDVATPLTFAEYQAGRDPALQAIRAIVKGERPVPDR